MTGELALALLLPGATALRRRPWAGGGMLVAGVAFPLAVLLYAVGSRRSWVALGLDASYLAWLSVAVAVAFATRVVAVALVWWDRGHERPDRVTAVVLTVAIALCLPLAVASVELGRASAAIAPTFGDEGAGALFDPAAPLVDDGEPTGVDAATAASTTPTTTPTTTFGRAPRPAVVDVHVPSDHTTTTTLPPKPERPLSGVDEAVVADVHTVLLLGGDAGPGRSGLRTDTMMLLSVHVPSGRAALVSLPRDTRRILFPPGSALEARYPYGFREIANSVYPIVSADASLRAAYEVDGVRPGVVATAQAIGYSLDVPIHDYVLVDMQGFLELIDAIGGVTVDVPKAVPMPGNIPGAPTQYPDVLGPGTIHMDGSTALGYVRSRKADSDFQRTRRQRQLLAALATQVSPADLVARIGPISSAIGGTLRTSLDPDELAELLALIGGETAIVESVGLVPPLVDIDRPDWGEMARIVGEIRVAIATGQRSGY